MPDKPAPQLWDSLSLQLLRQLQAGVPVDNDEGTEVTREKFRCGGRRPSYYRGLRSRDGRWLISVSVKPCRIVVKKDAEAEDPAVNHYFWYVDEKGVASPLGSDLELIAIGDYDGDGSSEVLFGFTAGDNHDAYLLFTGRFAQKAEFSWGYH